MNVVSFVIVVDDDANTSRMSDMMRRKNRSPSQLSRMIRATCPSEIDEVKVLATVIQHPLRDAALLVLGLETGLRLSELCNLLVKDCWRDGACISTLRLNRARLKGGRSDPKRARRVASRSIPLNERAQEFVTRYLQEREKSGPLSPQAPMFPSRQGGTALRRWRAWQIIRTIFLAAGCDPARTWSGHSLRRRFVRRVFDLTDLETARVAVGHADALCTARYIFLGEESSNAAILKIGRTSTTTDTQTGGAVTAAPSATADPAILPRAATG